MALAHPHAPSHGINTWRDFFVHIAVVAIGLLLALGLEQTVEYVHHRHQRAQFEEQMAETFRVNSRIDEDTFAALANIREYLVGLQNAVLARREGRVMLIPDAPPYTYLTLPTLGPYEAAQANGTLGLLPVDRIRLFQRIAFQHDIAANDLADYRHAVRALRAFRKRFDPSPAYDGRLLFMIPAADIDRLTPQ